MANVTNFTDGKQAVTRLGTQGVCSQAVIDFADYPCISGADVELLKIPANTIVHDVSVVVVTAEGAAAAMEVGDVADADFYIDSVDLNALGGNLQTAASPAGVAGGKYYSTAGVILGKLTAATDAAKVRVVANYSVVEQNG